MRAYAIALCIGLAVFPALLEKAKGQDSDSAPQQSQPQQRGTEQAPFIVENSATQRRRD